MTLVLSEADAGGGLTAFLNSLAQKVKEKVIAAIIKVGASEGPIGAIIGIAVSFVVGKVFDLIKNIWSDDIFKPMTASVNIASLNARWPGGKTDSPEAIATFKGHGGHYQVTYDWRMFA